MNVNNIELPKWMVCKINELYPELSTQAGIRCYLRDCLNKGTNYKGEELERLEKNGVVVISK